MINFAINAAKASNLFNHIIVTSDDEEIMDIARKCGAETPFTRPMKLGDDYATTIQVIAHAVEMCNGLGWKFDKVCCIYPAVPLIQPEDLVAALRLMNEHDVDFCFPVAEYPSQIQRALRMGAGGLMAPYFPEFETSRTQDLSEAFYDAGQFYWGRATAWEKNKKIHTSALGYPIPSWRAIDIDTEDDWNRAELIYRALFDIR
jgi:pseudaminic acid cytidylyltransferase